MKSVDRRTFLKTAGLALGGSLAPRFAPSAWAQPIGANDAIRVAVIGVGGKGADHVRHLLATPGARVVAVCDVDPRPLAQVVAELKEKQANVFAATDARRIFERPDVDAVVIATSNHWHALLTVWACQAGKDVYVEKPVSRTVWEGRQMVEAAAKYRRIVQAGTQYRSDSGLPAAIAWIRAGHLGKIQFIHTVCYKLRESIGRRLPWYPDWLDYDLFCGSTPAAPLERERLAYDWHWTWRTGNGELGNNGIHVLDIARRFAGHDALPRRVMSLGGRYVIDDVAETPNTQLTVFDYGAGAPVVFESRGLPAQPGAKHTDHFHGIRDNAFAVICEGGYYAGYTGGAAYDHKDQRIRVFEGDGGADHMGNFLAAVRSRRTDDLAAPIATGHASTTLCHVGNISYRLSRPGRIADARRTLADFPGALRTLEGMRKHLAVHGVDLRRQPLQVGPWLQVDAPNESIAAVEHAGDDGDALARARYLLHEIQRAPYAIPDQV